MTKPHNHSSDFAQALLFVSCNLFTKQQILKHVSDNKIFV